MAEPRIYLHPDGQTLSVGFEDTQDTLLFVQPGENWRDTERLARWVEAVQERIGHPPLAGRLTPAELAEFDRALEFEGYGTARDDLRELLRERFGAVVCEVCGGGGAEPAPKVGPGQAHVIWDYPTCAACRGSGRVYRGAPDAG